jgi:exoribonuclease R
MCVSSHILILFSLLEAALIREKAQKIPFGVVLDSSTLQKLANYCNEKKTAARRAQEQSQHVFLCLYLQKKPFIDTSIVVELTSKVIVVFSTHLRIKTQLHIVRSPLSRVCVNGLDMN